MQLSPTRVATRRKISTAPPYEDARISAGKQRRPGQDRIWWLWATRRLSREDTRLASSVGREKKWKVHREQKSVHVTRRLRIRWS